MDLNQLILTYLFDPDDGLYREIEENIDELRKEATALRQAHALCKSADARKPREAAAQVAEANVEFFADVWAKVKAQVGKERPKANSGQMALDIILAEWLVDRGWRDMNVKFLP